MRKISQRVM